MFCGRQVGALSCADVARSESSPHSSLTCGIPESSGTAKDVAVVVDTQLATSAGSFSYTGVLLAGGFVLCGELGVVVRSAEFCCASVVVLCL